MSQEQHCQRLVAELQLDVQRVAALLFCFVQHAGSCLQGSKKQCIPLLVSCCTRLEEASVPFEALCLLPSVLAAAPDTASSMSQSDPWSGLLLCCIDCAEAGLLLLPSDLAAMPVQHCKHQQ